MTYAKALLSRLSNKITILLIRERMLLDGGSRIFLGAGNYLLKRAQYYYLRGHEYNVIAVKWLKYLGQMRQELTGNIKKHKCVTLLGTTGDMAPGSTCLPLPPPPPPCYATGMHMHEHILLNIGILEH